MLMGLLLKNLKIITVLQSLINVKWANPLWNDIEQ